MDRMMRSTLHSMTLVLLHINLAVDFCYLKSVWFDYYNPQDDIQMKSYRFNLLFTLLEMFILSCAIVTVTKRKSAMLDWIIIILICNAIFTIFTKIVYLIRDEFCLKIANKVNEWNRNLSPASSESKLDLQTELLVTVVIECLYCFALIVLKIYSALTIHRYRNELESPVFIDTLLQRNYPPVAPLPKPPGYGLWRSPPSASEPDSNDPEAPPPYSMVNEKY